MESISIYNKHKKLSQIWHMSGETYEWMSRQRCIMINGISVAPNAAEVNWLIPHFSVALYDWLRRPKWG
jgi:hypothetical protein